MDRLAETIKRVNGNKPKVEFIVENIEPIVRRNGVVVSADELLMIETSEPTPEQYAKDAASVIALLKAMPFEFSSSSPRSLYLKRALEWLEAELHEGRVPLYE